MDPNEQFRSSGFDGLSEIIRSLYCRVGQRDFRIDITKDYDERNLSSWSAKVFVRNESGEYIVAFDCSLHRSEQKAFGQAYGGIHNYLYEIDTPVVTKSQDRQKEVLELEKDKMLANGEFVSAFLSTIFRIRGYQELTETQIDDLVIQVTKLPIQLKKELKTYLEEYKATDFKPYSFFGCRFSVEDQTERYGFIRKMTDKLLSLIDDVKT